MDFFRDVSRGFLNDVCTFLGHPQHPTVAQYAINFECILEALHATGLLEWLYTTAKEVELNKMLGQWKTDAYQSYAHTSLCFSQGNCYGTNQ